MCILQAQKCVLLRSCHLYLLLFIILFHSGMVALHVPQCLHRLYCSSYGSCMCESILVRFSSNMYMYIFVGNHLLQVILVIACMIRCTCEDVKNLFVSIVLNSYHLSHAYVCFCIDGYVPSCFLPLGSYSKYLLLVIGIHICGRYC